jgi:hypothetical protein
MSPASSPRSTPRWRRQPTDRAAVPGRASASSRHGRLACNIRIRCGSANLDVPQLSAQNGPIWHDAFSCSANHTSGHATDGGGRSAGGVEEPGNQRAFGQVVVDLYRFAGLGDLYRDGTLFPVTACVRMNVQFHALGEHHGGRSAATSSSTSAGGCCWLPAWAGAPLSAGHGYPLRLAAPGQRGYWRVKWVDRIELQATPWWWQPAFPVT